MNIKCKYFTASCGTTVNLNGPSDGVNIEVVGDLNIMGNVNVNKVVPWKLDSVSMVKTDIDISCDVLSVKSDIAPSKVKENIILCYDHFTTGQINSLTAIEVDGNTNIIDDKIKNNCWKEVLYLQKILSGKELNLPIEDEEAVYLVDRIRNNKPTDITISPENLLLYIVREKDEEFREILKKELKKML